MGPTDGLVLDTDPGVDDAIAILMALACPWLEVAGLTTVGGNVALSRATRNALALLEYAGRSDVPVVRGSARPLWRSFPYAHHFHGVSGLSRRLPRPATCPVAEDVADFLAARLGERPGGMTLVALGPLTNLARLLRREPSALGGAASLVVMGGAVGTDGNVTPHAEFNVYSDPLAARETLSSGVPLTLVDLGACREVFIDRERGMRLKSRDRLGRLVSQLVGNWFRKDPARTRLEFYDPLALAAALQPGLLTTRRVMVEVETSPGPQLGMTRLAGEGGPVSVVEGVDAEGFFALLHDWLALEGLPP